MKSSPFLSLLVGCLVGVCAPQAGVAQPANGAAMAQKAPERLSPEEQRKQKDWRDVMSRAPLPKKGCFNATYPSRAWQEVPCVTPPNVPMVPAEGPRPLVVGNTDDISAEVPTPPGGHITSSTGSFDSVTGVTSVASPTTQAQVDGGTSTPNAYSLQLNTNFLSNTPHCTTPPADNPNCQGWEQFVFSNNGASAHAFIQYWLYRFSFLGMTPCPGGWNSFTFSGDNEVHCYRNSVDGAFVGNQPITALQQQTVTGNASATSDDVRWASGGTISAATGDNAVSASTDWTSAEFNVFGYAYGGQANFNAGSTIVPRTKIFYGGTAAPNCLAEGTTGETNNLSFGPSAPAASQPGPAVLFTESDTGGAGSNCAAATTVGDTHLYTFSGLAYDFQATGDFVLAQVSREFAVQARQVSGAPTWPDASVNSAVATRMGSNKIAICLGGNDGSLNVNGNVTQLAAGKPLSLPGGVTVWRIGRTDPVYFATDGSGNSLRAQVHPSWIDVSVGLGRWPSTARGLLANVDGNVAEIATRGGQTLTAVLTQDGQVLRGTFPFDDLYHAYADSWRVPASESLLSVCGRATEQGIPTRPFYTKDLDPQVADHARGVCTAAGVKPGPLLEDCTLDVAVIGNDGAAKVYVGAREPVAVGTIVPGGGGLRGGGWLGQMTKCWCCLLVLVLLLVGSILLALFGNSTQGPLNILKWVIVVAGWLLALYCLVVRLL